MNIDISEDARYWQSIAREYADEYLQAQVAVTSATAATLFGTMAGLALARFGRFKGRPAKS